MYILTFFKLNTKLFLFFVCNCFKIFQKIEKTSLTWLVDLICYDTKAQELQEQHDTEDINVLFFEYLCNAYDSFMANDDEKYNFYDEELSETFQFRNDGK